MYTRLRETENRLKSHYSVTTFIPRTGVTTSYDTSFSGAEGQHKLIMDQGPFGKKPKVLSTNNVDIRRCVGTCTPSTLVATPNIDYWYGWRPGVVTMEGNIAGFAESLGSVGTAQSLPYNLGQEAMRKAHANASKPSADVGMMLAEISQTARMLTNPLKAVSDKLASAYAGGKRKYFEQTRKMKRSGITRSYTNLPRRSKKPSKKWIHDYMSEWWLIFRYGILPLMSDVDSLRNVYVAQEKALSKVVTVSGYASMGPTTTYATVKRTLYPFSIDLEQSRTVHQFAVSKLYFARELYYVSLGMSPFDIPSLIWELTPWSFCVDWVYDVGGFLRSIQPTPHLSMYGSCLSYKTQNTTVSTVRRANHMDTSKDAKIVNSGLYEHKVEMLQRTSNPPWARSLPSFNISGFGLLQATDTLSLIGQKLPKIF